MINLCSTIINIPMRFCQSLKSCECYCLSHCLLSCWIGRMWWLERGESRECCCWWCCCCCCCCWFCHVCNDRDLFPPCIFYICFTATTHKSSSLVAQPISSSLILLHSSNIWFKSLPLASSSFLSSCDKVIFNFILCAIINRLIRLNYKFNRIFNNCKLALSMKQWKQLQKQIHNILFVPMTVQVVLIAMQMSCPRILSIVMYWNLRCTVPVAILCRAEWVFKAHC